MNEVSHLHSVIHAVSCAEFLLVLFIHRGAGTMSVGEDELSAPVAAPERVIKFWPIVRVPSSRAFRVHVLRFRALRLPKMLLKWSLCPREQGRWGPP